MVENSKLMVLKTQQERYLLIAEYLRNASTDVFYDVNGEGDARTHIIVDTSEFPLVRIGVEDSPSEPVLRQFFEPVMLYRYARWELTDPSHEAALRSLIEQGEAKTAEAVAADIADLKQVLAKREAADNEAAARRNAALQSETRARLLAAWRTPREERQWALILQDLNLALESISRTTDKSFVAEQSAFRRRVGGQPTDPQLRWLGDILERTARALSSSPPTQE